jgi:hypothetical protein
MRSIYLCFSVIHRQTICVSADQETYELLIPVQEEAGEVTDSDVSEPSGGTEELPEENVDSDGTGEPSTETVTPVESEQPPGPVTRLCGGAEWHRRTAEQSTLRRPRPCRWNNVSGGVGP